MIVVGVLPNDMALVTEHIGCNGIRSFTPLVDVQGSVAGCER